MNIEAIQRRAAQFVEKWPGIVTGNQDVSQNYLNDLVGKPFRNQGLWSPRNFFGLHNQILLPTVSQFSVSKYTRLYLKIHQIVSQNTPDCVSKYTTLYLKIHRIVSQHISISNLSNNRLKMSLWTKEKLTPHNISINHKSALINLEKTL